MSLTTLTLDIVAFITFHTCQDVMSANQDVFDGADRLSLDGASSTAGSEHGAPGTTRKR